MPGLFQETPDQGGAHDHEIVGSQNHGVARSGWAHQCCVCGNGAAFGAYQRNGNTEWFCGEHRRLMRPVAMPPMPRTGARGS
ncbi:hypothetical protein [Acetobacter nitrogenifigens]|uniref:hypothetical protein n=1 Tax=Acetobacter nitrogenifigens TaxID=285268 RepID=UPI0004120186|nr:hypothetical protein [Acetobacter nitrogenifigens]